MTNKAEEKYSKETVLKMLTEENGGVHISLYDSGKTNKDGRIIMNIDVETDLNKDTLKNILVGMLNSVLADEKKAD